MVRCKHLTWSGDSQCYSYVTCNYKLHPYSVATESCNAEGKERCSRISGVRQGTKPDRVCTRHRGVSSSILDVGDLFVSTAILPSRTPLLVTFSTTNLIARLLIAKIGHFACHVVITLIDAHFYNIYNMVVYPPQLTSEEKALKKRYARLQELVRYVFTIWQQYGDCFFTVQTKEVRLAAKKQAPPSGKSPGIRPGTSNTQPQQIKKGSLTS